MATVDLNHVQFWPPRPLETHSFTSSAILHRAQAHLSAEIALETSQHHCPTQIDYSIATSPSLQLQWFGTKGMILRLEFKV
jgi:hypothetical protein